MANVLHKTRSPADYRVSVNTPDFPVADWFHNPDVSAVAGVAIRYWKVGTNPVQEMTQTEKDAIDATLLAAEKAAAKAAADSAIDGFSGYSLRAIAQLIIDEINILRADQVVGIATFAFDPANLADGAGASKIDITVTGWIQAANTVGIRLQNETGGAINLANGTWGVAVRRPVQRSPRTLAQAKSAYKAEIAGNGLDE